MESPRTGTMDRYGVFHEDVTTRVTRSGREYGMPYINENEVEDHEFRAATSSPAHGTKEYRIDIQDQEYTEASTSEPIRGADQEYMAATPSGGSSRGTETRVILNIKDKATAPSKLINTKDWPRWGNLMKGYFKAIGVIKCITQDPKKTDNSNIENSEKWKKFMSTRGHKYGHGEQQLLMNLFNDMQLSGYENVQEEEEIDILEELAQNKITNGVSHELYSVIQQCKTARQMWLTLESHCLGEASGERLILKQQFDRMHISATMTMEKFTTEFRNLMCDMERLSIRPGDFEQCNKLLDVLPLGTYGDFVRHHRYGLDEMVPSQLLILLRSESVRLYNWQTPFSQRKQKNGGFSFYNGDRGRGSGRGGRSRGRGSRGRRGGRGRGSNDGSVRACFRCWETDHISPQCPNEVRVPPSSMNHLAEYAVSNRVTAANVVSNIAPSASPNSMMSASNVQVNVSTPDELTQFFSFSNAIEYVDDSYMGIDSCTSVHLFRNKSLFTELHKVPAVSTKTADHGAITTSMVGTAHFIVKNRNGTFSEIKLTNVYYSGQVALNLFSTTQFAKAIGDGKVVCTADGAQICDKDWNVIFDAEIICGVPMAKLIPKYSGIYSNLNASGNHELWHCRLGHANPKILAAMKNRNIVDGFDYEPHKKSLNVQCEGCLTGKQVKIPFKNERSEIVYPVGTHWATDLFGPIRTKSKQGSYHGQVYLDYGSDYVFGNGLASKDQHPIATRNFVIMVQRQFDVKIKTIRSDVYLQ